MPDRSYPLISRLLHRVALGNRWVAQASFDLDQLSVNPLDEPKQLEHVFIAGLARAGTTIITRILYETDVFTSLTYRHMPFVLMPRLWKTISTKFHKKSELKERVHGDGIMVDYDSPEAFEEVYWKNFCGPEYLLSDRLIAHKPSNNTLQNFRCYVAAVIEASIDKNRRYLSKNNNNILRIDALHEAFPRAWVLIPFRNPIEHANSLLKQHQRLTKIQHENKFVLNYMEWLGHYEFGLGQRPFLNEINEFSQDTLEYWLTLWVNVYSYLEKKAHERLLFVSFEDLCDKPDIRNNLLSRLSLCGATLPVTQLSKPLEALVVESSMLTDEADRIYGRLRSKCLAKLGGV